MAAKYLVHAKIEETINTYFNIFQNKLDDVVNTINNLNQQNASQDQSEEDNTGQAPQQPVAISPESQTISDDELLDIMNVSVTNIPMPNQQPPQQDQMQSQSNITVDDDSQNIDLSYDANIELLRLLAVSRETWNSMDSETKKSMLGCQ